MSNVKIKVCGITSFDQLQQLALIGVHYAGFIFYEKSPRYVANKLSAEEVRSFSGIKKVGVFVNETTENILQKVQQWGLDMVQLHGDESPEFCKTLKRNVHVMKAFRLKGDENLNALLAPYNDCVNYFLFDTKAKDYGGTGKQFDWSVLHNATIAHPYFLSGGIGIENIEQVSSFLKTEPVFALDVNSKFETSPGVKDMAMVKNFVQQIIPAEPT